MTALIDYLPRYYADSRVVGNLMGRKQDEIDVMKAAASDVLAQYFVDTATWGLAYWERTLGIKTDETKPIAQRRSVVKAKLRGIGTVTLALIKRVAESFDNGTIEITEYNRNFLRPQFAGWTLHNSASVAGDYEITTSGQSYAEFVLTPGVQHTFSIETNTGSVWIDSFDSGGVRKPLDSMTWDSVESYDWDSVGNLTWNDLSTGLNGAGGVKSFVVPSDSAKIRITFLPLANATTGGPYRFKNPMLIRGTTADLPYKFEPRKDYAVGVYFVSTVGVPENISDVQSALRDIVPAHLAIDYVFVYTSYGVIEAASKTYGDIESAGLTFGDLSTWDA